MSKTLNQAGMPSGMLGRLLGRIMLWHNRQDNEWTVKLLKLDGKEKILEIGFGPGAAIEFIMKSYPNVWVAGVDHSEAMLEAANDRNRVAVDAGNVVLKPGSVESLPFEDAAFDKIFSINCIYFWENPVQGLTELYRVLKHGGRLAITVRDKNRDAYQAFRAEKLEQMLHEAGFSQVQVATNGVSKHPLICVLGTK